MKTMVVITQTETGWQLRLTTFNPNGKCLVTKYQFSKLIEAYAAASLLNIHIDNENVLPLRQYGKIA